MRRIGFVVLMLVSFFLAATAGASTLRPVELDRGDLVPSEYLVEILRGLEVFDLAVVDRDFGRRVFIWLDERGGPITERDWRISDFDPTEIENTHHFRRRLFTSAVPEPTAAAVFGIGAVMVAAAIRRR